MVQVDAPIVILHDRVARCFSREKSEKRAPKHQNYREPGDSPALILRLSIFRSRRPGTRARTMAADPSSPSGGGGGSKTSAKTKTSTPSTSSSSKMNSQSSFASAASSTASSSVSGSSNVNPLPSAEALHLLLSPDGYYRYLCIPKPPPGGPGFLQQQQNSDASKKKTGGGGDSFDDENDATKPLNPTSTSCSSREVDHDLVKKNYRRLSLRHHPDRPGGDADTFRVLNRAKRVLTNPKLRRQYDLLGLDLDDDDEDHHDEGQGSAGDGGSNKSGKSDGTKTDGSGGGTSSSSSSSDSPDSAMSHIASATIATIIQIAVRTAAMGISSTLICRYKITALPAICFMVFVAYRVRQAASRVSAAQRAAAGISTFQTVAPLIIAAGIVLMHYGRGGDERPWSWTFWLGEASVMTMFVVNSIQPLPAGRNATIAVAGIALLSLLLSLLLRGKFWRYVCVVAFEAVLAFLAVLAFPIMEMILEEIMNEKLRKIGEQVRAHARRMEAYEEKQKAAKQQHGSAK